MASQNMEAANYVYDDDTVRCCRQDEFSAVCSALEDHQPGDVLNGTCPFYVVILGVRLENRLA